MKKLLIATAAFVAMSLPAVAADVRMPVKAVAAAPVMSWTGCYIGGNVGVASAKTDQIQIAKVTGLPIVPNNSFGGSDASDFTGGGQIGCDYQFSNGFVVGVQGMYNFADINSTHVVTAFPTFISNNNTKDIWTLTGRVGLAFVPQLLGYVKGGGAWARSDHAISGTVPAPFLSETARQDRQGYTLGVGMEWMFSPGWSVFAEYNYLDFGRSDVRFVIAPGAIGTADVVRTDLQIQQGLVGVNYKFNFR
jgi:outer membrane immunogenic protein